MTSGPETSSAYGTRNKRRKLNDPETSPTIPQPNDLLDSPEPLVGNRHTARATSSRSVPLYSRNLDKALKSILSESPRMRNARSTGDSSGDSIDVTPSADDEASSSGVAAVQINGRTSTTSMSSQSRETTPQSSLGGNVVAIPPFIEFFHKERESGKVSKEVRDEALKILLEWHSEWAAEEKWVRELKRKIKNHHASHVEVPQATVVEIKPKARPSTSRPQTVESGKTVSAPMTSATAQPETPKPSESRPNLGGRKDSVTGPNGLTGTYWDLSTQDMGRGRRKSKVS